MSRVVRVVLFAAALAVLAAGGCGIPDNSAVVPVGPGPSRGVSPGDDRAPAKSLRTDTVDQSKFVLNYLTAAAGDYESATTQAKQFMSAQYAATFKPSSTDLKVIHLTAEPLVNPGSDIVTVTGRVVGELDNFGVLTPSSEAVEYQLSVGRVDQQSGWFIVQAPNVLLLSDTALSDFYTRRTIYFWNKDHTGLVPDVRYMSLSVPTEQQPTELLAWLTNGPAPWLAGVADPLPPGTKPIGVVPAVSDQRLQVSLSGQALPLDYERNDPTAPDRLQKQLRWSLRPNLPAILELNVEHQLEQEYADTGYLAANAAYRPIADPERFVLYDGQVRRLSRSYAASNPVPVLLPQANKNVVQAGIGGNDKRTYAALVVESKGVQTLQVGSAAVGAQAPLRSVKKLPKPIGRPEWAATPASSVTDGTVGLVTAGGKLYRFNPAGSAVRVTWSGGPSTINAVAIAPDGRRVALLSRGVLYLSTLLNDDDDPQLSDPIGIHTEMNPLTAVDWNAEGTLVVAGKKTDTKRAALMDVSIDGASQTNRLSDLGSNDIAQLAAYSASPTGNEDSGVPVAYQLGGAAYDEASTEEIGVADLAQPVTNPRTGVRPTSPFFLN